MRQRYVIRSGVICSMAIVLLVLHFAMHHLTSPSAVTCCSNWLGRWQITILPLSCLLAVPQARGQPPYDVQVAAAIGGRRKLRRRLTGWLHLSRSYVGRLDAVDNLHEAQPLALAYKQVPVSALLGFGPVNCCAWMTVHEQRRRARQTRHGAWPATKAAKHPCNHAPAAHVRHRTHVTMNALQEGLPYASLPGRQNPRRSEASGYKGGSAYLAPLHSRDKRWYIHAW